MCATPNRPWVNFFSSFTLIPWPCHRPGRDFPRQRRRSGDLQPAGCRALCANNKACGTGGEEQAQPPLGQPLQPRHLCCSVNFQVVTLEHGRHRWTALLLRHTRASGPVRLRRWSRAWLERMSASVTLLPQAPREAQARWNRAQTRRRCFCRTLISQGTRAFVQVHLK